MSNALTNSAAPVTFNAPTFIECLSTDEINNRVTAHAGDYFFSSRLSGSAWAMLARYAAELADRRGDDSTATAADLARAQRLLGLKPANFGA